MSNEFPGIPIDVLPYFVEIAERLWSGHAAVMVGAGFSRNAVKSDPAKNDLPNWNQLGDIFYEKIYRKQPDHNTHYLNVLKLADEVQAAFGRPFLDQLLRTQIADKDFEPSVLHQQLMELPWSDIFTTNYDTLLERAADSVLLRKYDVVVNQQDLIYSERPRIIKLHGSFPSERPLIITEEDYRKYPYQFAPFVNTVQQALLENTLCLLGFSGDDPNFLKWVGWINDNLGKDNSPKIYLLGVLNLSDAQRKLLESKNIVVVDLALCHGINNDHGKALQLFLDFLKAQKKKDRNLEWPGIEDISAFTDFSDEKKFEQLTAAMKFKRQTYPNWLIVPQQERQALWDSMKWSLTDEFDDIKAKGVIDLEFCFEINWRLEKCLMPVFNNVAAFFETVLDKYRYLFKEFGNHAESSPNSSALILREKWIELAIGLLRFCREENLSETWLSRAADLDRILTYFNPEQTAAYHCEKVLKAIFDMDINEAQKQVMAWPENPSIPYWETRRASLLAETGKIDEAIKIVERALTFIRKRQNLAPVSNDYGWVSQEAYTMLILRHLLMNQHLIRRPFEALLPIPEFPERWNYLAQYKSNPWQELKFFDLALEGPYTPPAETERKANFDIGRHTISTHFSWMDNGAFTAYSFFRFLEVTGFALGLKRSSVAEKTVTGGLLRIVNYSPDWTWAIIWRYGNDKVVKEILDRVFVKKIPTAKIDELISRLILHARNTLPEKSDSQFFTSEADSISEMLSRLCVKCSREAKVQLFEFMVWVYQRNIRLNDIGQLWSRLVGASPGDLQYGVLPVLLNIPLLDNTERNNEHLMPEPFLYLRLYGYNAPEKLRLRPSVVAALLEEVRILSGKRGRAVTRLLVLQQLNLLSPSQKTEFFKLLWKFTDSSGFPRDARYLKFAFLKFPHPKNVDPLALFKTYILDTPLPVQNKREGKGVTMTYDKITWMEEFTGASATIHNQKGIRWTSDELSSIFLKLRDWWQADQRFLDGTDQSRAAFGSISIEFRQRFGALSKAIALVFGYQKESLPSEIVDEIIIMLREMNEKQVPVLQAGAAFFDRYYSSRQVFEEDLQNSLMSDNQEVIVNALDAVIMTGEQEDILIEDRHFAEQVIEILLQPLRWRLKNLMADIFTTLGSFITYHPAWVNEQLLLTSISVLDDLYKKTDLENDSEYQIDEKLLYRKKSIKLAKAIEKYLLDAGRPVPDTVLKWTALLDDTEEFADVIIS